MSADALQLDSGEYRRLLKLALLQTPEVFVDCLTANVQASFLWLKFVGG